MRLIRFLSFLGLFFLMGQASLAQQSDSTARRGTDSVVTNVATPKVKTGDINSQLMGVNGDSVRQDSAVVMPGDSSGRQWTGDTTKSGLPVVLRNEAIRWSPAHWGYDPSGKTPGQRVTARYQWFSHQQPVGLAAANTLHRAGKGKEFLFYVIYILLLYLGLIKLAYPQFFNNIFRVYLNTSLRQSQLTEQLLQARWPSFLMNVFFMLVAGMFIWLLLRNKPDIWSDRPYLLLGLCVAGVAVMYIIKFCFLKFIGWISGIGSVTDQYIFVIFLVNKLLSILLLPFIVLLAFSKSEWSDIITTFSLLCAGVVLMSRYIKSYGLLGSKVMVHPFHFFLFFVGAELLPPFLIYKMMVSYFML